MKHEAGFRTEGRESGEAQLICPPASFGRQSGQPWRKLYSPPWYCDGRRRPLFHSSPNVKIMESSTIFCLDMCNERMVKTWVRDHSSTAGIVYTSFASGWASPIMRQHMERTGAPLLRWPACDRLGILAAGARICDRAPDLVNE